MSKACYKPEQQVYLCGNSLRGKDHRVVKRILSKCTMFAPIHVVKGDADQSHCFVHFAQEDHAAAFFWRYGMQKQLRCHQLQDVVVRPSRQSHGEQTRYVSFTCSEKVCIKQVSLSCIGSQEGAEDIGYNIIMQVR